MRLGGEEFTEAGQRSPPAPHQGSQDATISASRTFFPNSYVTLDDEGERQPTERNLELARQGCVNDVFPDLA